MEGRNLSGRHPVLEVCKKICQFCLPLGRTLFFLRISVSNFNLNSFSASLRDRNSVQPPLRYRNFDAIYEARCTRFVSAFGFWLCLAM